MHPRERRNLRRVQLIEEEAAKRKADAGVFNIQRTEQVPAPVKKKVAKKKASKKKVSTKKS